MDDIVTGIQVLVIFLGMTTPILVVGVVYYLKKRLEHKQIMAAIEKGTPLSELVPPKPRPIGPPWIKYISGGVGLIIIGFGYLVGGSFASKVFLACVFLGVAAIWITRGLLYRKYYLKSQSANQNDVPPNKVSA